MYKYDVCVIGGGLLGCMAARELMRYNLKVLLIEKREDVCTGISRANTAIVYAGYDSKPKSLKSRLTVQGNSEFSSLCEELGVKFKRCGSLMLAFGENGVKSVEKKYSAGIEAGVPGLRIISGAEVSVLEPEIGADIKCALFSPTTGTVNPWELGIAAFENARANGCKFLFNTEVTQISRQSGVYEITTSDNSTVLASGIINCAGENSDTIYEMTAEADVRIFTSGGDYIISNTDIGSKFSHVIFCESENKKGITIVPTTEGNLLIGSEERSGSGETSSEGLSKIIDEFKQISPQTDIEGNIIRSFGVKRPNPYEVTRDSSGNYVKSEKSIGSFVIKQADAMVSLIGIKTPGITCSNVLAKHCISLLFDEIGVPENNPYFSPIRKAPLRINELSSTELNKLINENPAYGRIVCHCNMVSEAEIVSAIERGAVTVDGVKRRTTAFMGRCQGGRCMQRICELLSETLNIPIERIDKDAVGSYIFTKHDKL